MMQPWKKQQEVKVMDLAQKNDGRRRYNGLLYPVANSPRQRGREGKYCVRKGTELMHKRAEKWPWVTSAGNKRFWPTWTARSKWGKEPVEKAQLIERSLRYAAGTSRKLTLGLRRYFQVLNSEYKVSGSPVVFCRCSQGFLALLLLFSIHVRTPNIQQAPERTQPLLKSLTEKRRKITSVCTQSITGPTVGEFHVVLVLFLRWRGAVS